jgi:CheY-like chemotaxis protein
MREISVLLVEDNKGDALLIKRQLSRAQETQFKVHHVGWLKSALQTVELLSYDVILLDLSLPDCQGLDTVVEFLRVAPVLPVVVMTGNDDMDTAVKCVRYGATDYVLKRSRSVRMDDPVAKADARNLEITIVTAIERKRADLVGKQLIHRSLAGYGTEGNDSATVVMMREYALGLAAALQDVRLHVAKNMSGQLDNIDAILERHNVPVMSRDMHMVMHLGPGVGENTRDTPVDGSRRRRIISTQAMKAVSAIVEQSRGEMPTDPPQAEAALLDVITRNTAPPHGH